MEDVVKKNIKYWKLHEGQNFIWAKICKTRPNRGYDSNKIYKSVISHELTFSREEYDEFLEIIKDERSTTYLQLDVNDVIRYVNRKYNTKFCHCQDRSNYQTVYSPEKTTGNIYTFEVLSFDDVEEVLGDTAEDKRRKEAEKTHQAHQRLIKTMFKDNINAILDKYGMYMNDYIISFKDREKMLAIIQDYFNKTIVKELDEIGIKVKFNNRLHKISQGCKLFEVSKMNIDESKL